MLITVVHIILRSCSHVGEHVQHVTGMTPKNNPNEVRNITQILKQWHLKRAFDNDDAKKQKRAQKQQNGCRVDFFDPGLNFWGI